MERVIFRREYDPYMKEWGFLAAFPDDDAGRGLIAAVPFKIREGKAVFENYGEISLDYYYHKKLIKRKDPAMGTLRKALEDRYNTKFRVCEKI